MSITTVFGIVVMLLLLSVSCGGGKNEVVAVEFDPEGTYTMRTTDIVSLISDSGVTRYRVTSPEMLIFDKAAEPYWYFPQGVYFERFDSLFTTDVSIKADTAYNWNRKRLWKLIGNVDVKNLEGDRFETDTLYWDQETEQVYSEAFMRITREEQVLTGIGFESNQNMTKYRIKRPQGSFPVNEEENSDSTTVGKTQEIPPDPVSFPPVQRERPQRRALPGTAEKDSVEILTEEEPPVVTTENTTEETTQEEPPVVTTEETTQEEPPVVTTEEITDTPPSEQMKY